MFDCLSNWAFVCVSSKPPYASEPPFMLTMSPREILNFFASWSYGSTYWCEILSFGKTLMLMMRWSSADIAKNNVVRRSFAEFRLNSLSTWPATINRVFDVTSKSFWINFVESLIRTTIRTPTKLFDSKLKSSSDLYWKNALVTGEYISNPSVPFLQHPFIKNWNGTLMKMTHRSFGRFTYKLAYFLNCHFFIPHTEVWSEQTLIYAWQSGQFCSTRFGHSLDGCDLKQINQSISWNI